MPTGAPYGSWNSPITSDMVVQNSVRLGSIALDGADIFTGLKRDRMKAAETS